MSANNTARHSFANLAPTMRNQYALKLRRCRLSEPVEPLWGRAYRLVEWTVKSDASVQRCIVPADCTPSELADTLKSHIPGRRYHAEDNDSNEAADDHDID